MTKNFRGELDDYKEEKSDILCYDSDFDSDFLFYRMWCEKEC